MYKRQIAAHAADIAKGVKGASEWDRQMGMARKKLDWEKTFELSIDPEKARNYRASAKPEKEDTCSTVSYTHLDVYKRQGYCTNGSFIMKKPV